MKQSIFIIIIFALAACVLALLGYIVDSIELRWAVLAGALGLLGAGLALNSHFLALRLDNRMDEMDATLSRIENLQREIQKAQEEHAESSSPMVMSLQALSQHYMDYLTKQAAQAGEGDQE